MVARRGCSVVGPLSLLAQAVQALPHQLDVVAQGIQLVGVGQGQADFFCPVFQFVEFAQPASAQAPERVDVARSVESVLDGFRHVMRTVLSPRPTSLSPAASEGTSSSGSTGTQGPRRWSEGGFSPKPSCR